MSLHEQATYEIGIIIRCHENGKKKGIERERQINTSRKNVILRKESPFYFTQKVDMLSSSLTKNKEQEKERTGRRIYISAVGNYFE